MADRFDQTSPEVDRAGVDLVLKYELAAGRTPEEQEHGNPGYDVLSRGSDRSVARVIEIKSTAGQWAERGVPVSKTQIAENRRVSAQFWLYVVEYALDPMRARVIAIQDPISSVDYFVFDRGWESKASSTVTFEP